MLLKELCYIETKTINPQNYPEKNFLHYSLPNFDIDRKPKYEKGKYIMSAKYIVPQNAILFNKLNVRFKRIWNVQDNTYPYSICSGELLPLVVNNSCVIQKYLYYYLLTDKVNNILVENAHGTSTSHQRIKPINLMNIEVPIPLIKKQNHIVDTIGSIDDLIEHKLLLLDKLEQLEKNLYLKECLNKDKFSLLDRLQFIKGKKPKNFTDNGIDYLTIDALENGNLTYTNDEKLVYCKTNDILMVMDGASSGKVYIGYNGVVGSTLAKIKTNINPYYLYIYLKNNYKNIREHNIGSAIPHTNKDIIYTLKISNNTISNEIYNFLLNTRINLNIEIIHLKSLKTSYLKKFFG
jgi:type I restriction-modification system specificity subunit